MKYQRRIIKNRITDKKKKVFVPYYRASPKEILQDMKIINIDNQEIKESVKKNQEIIKKTTVDETDEKEAIQSLVMLNQSVEKFEVVKPKPVLLTDVQAQNNYNLQQFWLYYPYYLCQNYNYAMNNPDWYCN